MTDQEIRRAIIDGTAIDNLSVGGSLYLRGTQISSLPDNLSVGGVLDLRDTQISILPDNLSVGRSLYLSGTQISSLPDNLSVGRSLYLSGTQISSIYCDERDWELFPIIREDTIWWAAGCRFFQSTEEALNHWNADSYPVTSRGQMFCQAINDFVATQ